MAPRPEPNSCGEVPAASWGSVVHRHSLPFPFPGNQAATAPAHQSITQYVTQTPGKECQERHPFLHARPKGRCHPSEGESEIPCQASSAPVRLQEGEPAG